MCWTRTEVFDKYCSSTADSSTLKRLGCSGFYKLYLCKSPFCWQVVDLDLSGFGLCECPSSPLCIWFESYFSPPHPSQAPLLNLQSDRTAATLLAYCRSFAQVSCASFHSMIRYTTRTPTAPTAQMSAAWLKLYCSDSGIHHVTLPKSRRTKLCYFLTLKWKATC